MITTIESQDHFNEVSKLNDAALFYFSHEQCNVCKVLKPKIDELLFKKFPKIKMYYCNTNKLAELAAQNSIFAVPTIIVYFTGKETIRKSRNIAIQELENLISRPYEMIFTE